MLLQDKEKISVPQAFLKKFVRPMVFRLTKNNTPYDHVTRSYKTPRSYSLELHFNYFDDNTRQQTTLRFAETISLRQTRSGAAIDIFTPERISFRKGQIICDPNKPGHVELAYWLSIHPRNPGSPYFEKGKPAIFELEDKQAEAKERNNKRTARAKAEQLIFDEWSNEELVGICRSFGVRGVDDLSIDEVRDTLAGIMDQDPIDFIKRAEDENMVIYAHISHARDLGVLLYDADGMVWKWGPVSGSSAEIVRVRPGEDEKKRLIQHWERVPKAENIDYFYEVYNAEKEKRKAERDARMGRKPKKKEEEVS